MGSPSPTSEWSSRPRSRPCRKGRRARLRATDPVSKDGQILLTIPPRTKEPLRLGEFEFPLQEIGEPISYFDKFLEGNGRLKVQLLLQDVAVGVVLAGGLANVSRGDVGPYE